MISIIYTQLLKNCILLLMPILILGGRFEYYQLLFSTHINSNRFVLTAYLQSLDSMEARIFIIEMNKSNLLKIYRYNNAVLG